MSTWGSLTGDMLRTIFYNLPTDDIFTASIVCKSWNVAVKVEKFWEKYCYAQGNSTLHFSREWKITAKYFRNCGVYTKDVFQNPIQISVFMKVIINYHNNRFYQLHYQSLPYQAILANWSEQESKTGPLVLPQSRAHCFSFGSDFLVLGTKRSQIIIYNRDTGTECKKFDQAHNGKKIESILCFENLVISVDSDGELKVWDINMNSPIKTIQTGIQEINRLTKLSGNRILIFSTKSMQLFVLNLDDGKLFPLNQPASISGNKLTSSCSACENKIAVISETKKLFLWNLDFSDMPREIDLSYSLTKWPYSADNQFCAISSHILITADIFYEKNKSVIRGWNVNDGAFVFADECNFLVQWLHLDQEKLIVWSQKKVEIFHFSKLHIRSLPIGSEEINSSYSNKTCLLV